MEQDSKLYAHDIVWQFAVTDPRLHSKGYTVYKVTCKNFPAKSPEILTEMVCWKRYNDFKMLYKSLMTLHKAQHRTDTFPEFARPILFGRFAESVIENRRQSSVDLLNFISTQPHLYKSAVFKEFLEEGRVQSDFNKRGTLLSSRSSNQNFVTSSLKVDVSSESDILSKEVNNRELKVDESTLPVGKLEKESTDPEARLLLGKVDFSSNKTEQTLLEGTWNFPQVADNISLGSSTGEETIDTDDESVVEGSLPNADLTSFSKISPDYHKPAVDGISRSISRNTNWVLEGLNMCADLESNSKFVQGNVESDFTITNAIEESTNIFKESTLDMESSISRVSRISFSTLENYHADVPTVGANEINDLVEDDSIRRMSQSSGSSKTECGRGDLDLSVELQGRSSSFGSGVMTSSGRSHSTYSSQAKENPHSGPATIYVGTSSCSQSVGLDSSLDLLGRKPAQKHTESFLKNLVSGNPVLPKARSMTGQSISTMSIGGKEDYIFQAANQISKAQNRETNGDYEMAFAYYKSGVGILLHGVQGDTNKFRRDAVRRKTAKYLMKAEDLFNRHLANEIAGELRWGNENFLSPSLDPSFAFIRGSPKELRNFQVLATVDRVILVRHKITDETFVIKSISKSSIDIGSTKSVLPTSCPYMVSLHRFYETEDSVFLLLEYASGGKLWTYIEDYLNSARSSIAKLGLEKNNTKTDCKHIYLGVRSNACNKEENAEQDKNKLNGILKDEDPSNVYQNLEGAEFLKSDNSLQFLMQNKEVSELCANDKLFMKSGHHSENFEVDKKAYRSDDLDILNVSDFSDVLPCSLRTQPLDRRLSSLSDDCPAVGEQESSVLSPISLPEDSFQCLLLENEVDCEAFSINSINNEDTNHNFSFSENVCSIPTNTDCNNSLASSALTQTRAYDVLPITKEEELSVINQDFQHSNEYFSSNFARKGASPISSEDIIRKSKELLTQVEKILVETKNTTEKSENTLCKDHSQLKPLFPTSNNKTQEHIKCEDTSSFVGGTLSDNWERDFDSALPDKLSLSLPQHDIDTSDFVNASNTSDEKTCKNAFDFQEHSLSRARKTKSTVFNAVTETENKKNHTHVVISNNASQFGQVNTPRKLSMSYRGMMRSASFDCDFRSPARSRATTVSYLFEHLNSTSIAPTQIPESCIRKWMAQMITAVSRLHSLGVVCRDLKPSNILLGDGGQVYLTYFYKLGNDDQRLNWDAKENLYAAPEVGSVNRYDRSCDWWSLGALLYELVVGRSLGECHPGGINSHTHLYIPTFVSNETKGLLEGLLRHNPKERLGSGIAGPEEIKAHPFFTGVDWHALEYS